VMNLRVLAPRN